LFTLNKVYYVGLWKLLIKSFIIVNKINYLFFSRLKFDDNIGLVKITNIIDMHVTSQL